MATKDVRSGNSQQKVSDLGLAVIATEAAAAAVALGSATESLGVGATAFIVLAGGVGAASGHRTAIGVVALIAGVVWAIVAGFVAAKLDASDLTTFAVAAFVGVVGMGLHVEGLTGSGDIPSH